MKFDPNAIPSNLPALGPTVARITALKHGTSKNNGSDYWRLTWDPLGQYDTKTGAVLPYTGDVDPAEGILSFSPAALAGTGRSFFGLRVTEAMDSEDERAAQDMFVGRVAIVEIKHEEYNGSTRAKADNIKVAPPAVLSQFPDRVKPGAAAGDGGYRAPPNNGAGPTSTFTDDDIPF